MSLGDSASPLGKIQGLGSARAGGKYWLTERVTSIALLLLGIWVIASLMLLQPLDRPTLIRWLRTPGGALPMILLVIVSFKHALNGMKVVVDDYVRDDGNRFALHLLLRLAAVVGAALALFALASIAFGGPA